jgi:uncharacterized membrane protein
LYNIGLSGAQDYSSEYASLTQEMYEDLDSLRERYYNGELTESEYTALVE